MPEEPIAVPTPPALGPAEAEYAAICAAMMETARGRWFLAEYGRRNRQADTRLVLDAIERLEAALCSERAALPRATDRVRTELIEIARAIDWSRGEIAALKSDAISKTRVMQFLRYLERRIAATIEILGGHAEESGADKTVPDDTASGTAGDADRQGIAPAALALLVDGAEKTSMAAAPEPPDRRAQEARPGTDGPNEQQPASRRPLAVIEAIRSIIKASTEERPAPMESGAPASSKSAGSAAPPTAETEPAISTPMPENPPVIPAAAKAVDATDGRAGQDPSLLNTDAGPQAAGESGPPRATTELMRAASGREPVVVTAPPAHGSLVARAAAFRAQPRAAMTGNASDPLAPIMALSEEEKIALFS